MIQNIHASRSIRCNQLIIPPTTFFLQQHLSITDELVYSLGTITLKTSLIKCTRATLCVCLWISLKSAPPGYSPLILWPMVKTDNQLPSLSKCQINIEEPHLSGHLRSQIDCLYKWITWKLGMWICSQTCVQISK